MIHNQWCPNVEDQQAYKSLKSMALAIAGRFIDLNQIRMPLSATSQREVSNELGSNGFLTADGLRSSL